MFEYLCHGELLCENRCSQRHQSEYRAANNRKALSFKLDSWVKKVQISHVNVSFDDMWSKVRLQCMCVCVCVRE